jgi:hypothetical protein
MSMHEIAVKSHLTLLTDKNLRSLRYQVMSTYGFSDGQADINPHTKFPPSRKKVKYPSNG